jgi:hypothetical protein
MTDALISLEDLQEVGGTPRVLDLKLAEALGLEAPLSIRIVIKRNQPEIGRYGEVLSCGLKTSARGGRPTREYWLNEAQAILIAMFSRTERAADVREQVIRTFMAYRRSRTRSASEADATLATVPTGELRGHAALIREARLLFGRAEAAQLWRRLGLPDLTITGAAADNSTIGQFAAACLRSASGGRIQARRLYETFRAWCVENGFPVSSENAFGRDMKRRFRRDDRGQTRAYCDIALHDVPTRPDLPEERGYDR